MRDTKLEAGIELPTGASQDLLADFLREKEITKCPPKNVAETPSRAAPLLPTQETPIERPAAWTTPKCSDYFEKRNRIADEIALQVFAVKEELAAERRSWIEITSNDIAARLTSKQIRTARGVPWDRRAVERSLRRVREHRLAVPASTIKYTRKEKVVPKSKYSGWRSNQGDEFVRTVLRVQAELTQSKGGKRITRVALVKELVQRHEIAPDGGKWTYFKVFGAQRRARDCGITLAD